MQDIANALTWTFIHSLWQGLLAALLSAIIIGATRNATARMRYNLLGVVMMLFLASSVITFIIQLKVEATPAAVFSATFSDNDQVINDPAGTLERFMAWVNANSDTIIMVWTFFFLFSCLRLVTGLAAVNRLKHYKTHAVTQDWQIKLEQLQLMIGVRCSVSFLQSELVKGPMALGILKPVILVPLGLLTHLPPEQVETILLHELAHIRRRDYLVNLLQHIAEAIFFFNPAIRWISSLIREEREASCDDMVIASCNQKTNYINALISSQEYSVNHSSYTMGISYNRYQLLHRVKRIMTNKNKGINFFELMILVGGVLLFSAFSFGSNEAKTKYEAFTSKEPTATILPTAMHQTVIIEKINLRNNDSADTIPLKKNKPVNKNKPTGDNKPIVKPEQWEQAANESEALQRIIYIKDQIGLKKESIGQLKEKLNTKDEKEKEKILKELKRQRNELEAQRRELDLKREEWNKLKEKAREKQKEEQHPNSKTKINYEKANEADQWDTPDQWEMSDAWDIPPAPPAPENLKVPGSPSRKAQPARPGTGN